ncbi:Putative 1-aminocyclopropane-1-carboxylate deaminase [Frankliniella fusca]|uniref:1-aminocyclopropane-1-carboxylate deaminase n=1 Tax=Frankliniella fusca TaxID=407009 RepID=A0AAE1L685_9NEOP|nr:Putative 1-aminocyclopropane-1-carboxylate deaminase [Frankliniella fusca]
MNTLAQKLALLKIHLYFFKKLDFKYYKILWCPKGYLGELRPFGRKFRPFCSISYCLAAIAVNVDEKSSKYMLGVVFRVICRDAILGAKISSVWLCGEGFRGSGPSRKNWEIGYMMKRGEAGVQGAAAPWLK